MPHTRKEILAIGREIVQKVFGKREETASYARQDSTPVLRLAKPFYYSDSHTDRAQITELEGCRLVEIKGEKHLALPLWGDRLLFIPAEGLVQTEPEQND